MSHRTKSRAKHSFNPLSRRTFLGAGAALTAGALSAPYIRPASALGRPLRFWTWLDPNDSNPRAQVQTAMVKRFEEATGIEVDTEVVDWRTLSQQLIRAVAAGEGPDVTRIYSAWLPEHVTAGTLMPIEPMMSEVWNATEREDVGPPLPTFGGKAMAMYIENRIYLLYYRADYLEEAGLEVPRTLAQTADAAAAIANTRRSGLIWPASTRSSDTYSYASPMLWSLGGEFVHADMSAAFDEGGALEFYSWLKSLVLEHKAMPPTMISVDEEVLQQAINSGTCGMAFMGSNRLKSTREALAADDPMVLQTTHAPSADGSPPPVPVAGWCLGVTQNSERPVDAFRLIDALTDTEAQIMNAKKAGEMPVRTSALADPWFDKPEASEMRSWIEYVAQQGRDDLSQKLVKARELNRLLNIATQEMILKDRPVKEALSEAAAEWDAIAE